MSRLSLTRWQSRAICLAALTISSTAFAFAQDGPPPPHPPFGGPGGGGPGGGGPRGFRPMGFPPPVSAATVPFSLLKDGLALNEGQETSIRGILDKLRDDRRALMPGGFGRGPGGGGPGGGGPGRGQEQGGPPPDFEAMKANMEKVRTLEKQAADKVEAVLSSDQKTKLAELLKDASLLRDAGLPMEVAPDLKLTDEQRTSLKALAPPKPGEGGGSNNGTPPPRREPPTAKAMAILTSEQRVIVNKFIRENPRPQFGGPGGQGGPGGRPGGPGGFGGGPGRGPGGGRPGPGGQQGPPPPDGI